MAGISVPGNSCNPCLTSGQAPCLINLADVCVYYSGANISSVNIHTGDNLSVVINKLATSSGAILPTFNNGTSNISNVVQLGQPVGQSGNPGKLLSNVEIPTNTFNLTFPGSIGNTSTIADTGDITAGRVLQASGFRSFGAGQGFGMVVSRSTTTATGDARGFADQTVFTGSTAGIAYAGFDAAAQLFNSGAATYDHLVGFQCRVVFDSPGGTMTNMYGHTTDGMASKHGSTTNWYDFYAQVMNSGSIVSPAVSNRYNFYAEGDVRATNNWGVYINGGQNNYLGTGTTLIGTNSIVAGGYTLQVNTDALINGIPIGNGPNNVSGNLRMGKFTMAGAVTGGNNTAIGTGALVSLTSGVRNHFLGHNAGLFLTTGTFNTGMGETVLDSLSTGNNNTAIGQAALHSVDITDNNTGIGATAGSRSGNTLTGSNNTFLGAATTFSNNAINQSTAIGYGVSLASSNTVILGTATESVGLGGVISPTAKLQLPAGTATAGTAPLKLTPGVLLSVLELGAVEFTDDGTTGHLYITLHQGGVLTRVQIV